MSVVTMGAGWVGGGRLLFSYGCLSEFKCQNLNETGRLGIPMLAACVSEAVAPVGFSTCLSPSHSSSLWESYL